MDTAKYSYYIRTAGVPAAVLPSTSPANAAWSPARLQAAWGAALAPFLRADGCK